MMLPMLIRDFNVSKVLSFLMYQVISIKNILIFWNKYEAQTIFDRKLKKVAGKLADTNAHMSSKEVAQLCVYKKFYEIAHRENATAGNVRAVTEVVTPERFKNDWNTLYENRIFKNVARKHQANAWEKWNEVLAKTEELHTKYDADAKAFLNGDAGVDYIIHEGIDPRAPEQNVPAENPNP